MVFSRLSASEGLRTLSSYGWDKLKYKLLCRPSMESINVIYTPDAGLFHFEWFYETLGTHPDNAEVKQLRVNYDRLGSFIEIPNQVGVVTFNVFLKNSVKSERQKRLEHAQIYAGLTNYPPLDMLNSAIAQKQNDSSGLERYVASSSMMTYLSDSSLSLDETLSNEQRALLYLGSSLAHLPKVRAVVNEGFEKAQQFNDNELLKTLREAKEIIDTTYPFWEDLYQFRDYLQERFEANQVSDSIPLLFFPPQRVGLEILYVSLLDEIEHFDSTLIEKGCAVAGLDKIPEDIASVLDSFSKDKFGITKSVGSLNQLLEKLPEPKTIITDIFIVDQFSELKGKINPIEYIP